MSTAAVAPSASTSPPSAATATNTKSKSPSSSTSASTAATTTASGLSKDSIFYRAVADFRTQFRRENIPASYSEYLHFGEINLIGITCALLTGYLAGGTWQILTTPSQLLTAVIAFFYNNAFEYYTHRYNLHATNKHTRHSHIHHRFFTDRVMEFDNFRDVHAILFPERAPFFLAPVVVITSMPVWLLAGFACWMTFAHTLFVCYVTYEWLHLAYHSPPSSFLGSLPGIAYLRRHHQIHHSQALMNKWNFNITFPITDMLLGTTWQGPMTDSPGVPDTKGIPTPKDEQ